MEKIDVALNKIKQPKPDISANGGEKRVIYNPYVGIISDINPSSTPISDTLTIKGKEVPKSKYKPFQIKNNAFNFNNIATGGIITCGILALFSLFRKK